MYADLTGTVELYAENARAFHDWGHTHQRMGQAAGAVARRQEAVDLDPDDKYAGETAWRFRVSCYQLSRLPVRQGSIPSTGGMPGPALHLTSAFLRDRNTVDILRDAYPRPLIPSLLLPVAYGNEN